MPFKNLEHDGGEDFSTRSDIKTRSDLVVQEKSDKEKEKEKEKEKARAQEEYLSINNPALWEDIEF